MNITDCNGLCGCDDGDWVDATEWITCVCGFTGDAEGSRQDDYFVADCPTCGTECDKWDEVNW